MEQLREGGEAVGTEGEEEGQGGERERDLRFLLVSVGS